MRNIQILLGIEKSTIVNIFIFILKLCFAKTKDTEREFYFSHF